MVTFHFNYVAYDFIRNRLVTIMANDRHGNWSGFCDSHIANFCFANF